MPAGSISANIFAKCSVAKSSDIDRCGAVTLCNVSPTLSTELEGIYKDAGGKWRVIGALLEADFMGRACQIKENGIYDWIMANRRDLDAKRLSPQKINSGLHEVMPFIKMKRKHPNNNEYWTVTSGDGAGGTINGEAYDYTALVASQTDTPADVRWFPDKLRVFINGVTAGGTATRTAWIIVYQAEESGKVRLYLNSQNAASSLAAAKIDEPSTGMLVRGTPNVHDAEKFCAMIPGLNTNQITPFWVETIRWSLCEDELFYKFMKAIKENNPYYREFGDIEAVELNRQVIEDHQRRHAWSFIFNKPLANQTLALYNNLEEIDFWTDETEGNYLYLPFEGRCVGRRANAVGIYEQHAECGRVKDLQGNVLNIPELQAALYKIKRTRSSNGIPSDTIEMFTDSAYAPNLAQGFLRYFKDKSEGLLRLNQDLSSNVKQGPMGFYFQEFQMDYPAVKLRIVTHEFWDDMLEAHKNASSTLEDPGRFLWILDWTSNYQAIIQSNAVINRSGTIQEIAKVNDAAMCVMSNAKKTWRHNSLTYANVAECPQSSLLLENIDPAVPEHEAKVGDYADYYGSV